jgi:uncharacterized membrane protein/mono/diheme cytochrome c family protein
MKQLKGGRAFASDLRPFFAWSPSRGAGLLSTLALLVAGLAASPALAEEGNLPPALGVVARTHLLLLHFPIAVLYATLILELLLRKKVPAEGRRDVTSALLLVGALGTVAASATGLLYAADTDWRGHTATMLAQHRAGGLVTTVLAIAALVAFRKPSLRAAYLPLLCVAVLSVSLTGHRGGDLVHGEGYLFASFENKERKGDKEGDEPERAVASDGDEPGAEDRQRWPEGAIPENPTYAADIKPLIDRSCVKCHGPEKRKGGLRLDKERYALKGGETGPAVVPGDVAASLLIKYITLPPDDEDVMPSKGKLLAQSEIETLKKWIAQGASWPEDR